MSLQCCFCRFYSFGGGAECAGIEGRIKKVQVEGMKCTWTNGGIKGCRANGLSSDGQREDRYEEGEGWEGEAIKTLRGMGADIKRALPPRRECTRILFLSGPLKTLNHRIRTLNSEALK